MSIKEAIKNNSAIEVELDVYLLEDGRTVKYDRYRKGSCRWVCDDGYAYRNFFECFYEEKSFAQRV